MGIAVNIYYTGTNGAARKFAEEMESSGTAAKIRNEKGNLRYDYFFPMADTGVFSCCTGASDGSFLLHFTAVVRELATAEVKVASDFEFAMSQGPAVPGATGKEQDALREKPVRWEAFYKGLWKVSFTL